MHEAQLYGINNSFITATYNDENVPSDYSLNHVHFQKLIRSIRKKNPQKIRYYMSGEYGEQFGRPHFHACLFNKRFKDQKYHSTTDAGGKIYTSEELQASWQYGFTSTAELNFLTAAYVARYIMKKITGDLAYQHYEILDTTTGEIKQRTPEYNHMSLKPGIGAQWYQQYKSDVYPEGKVVVNAKKILAPRYYDNIYKREQPEEYELLTFGRYLETIANYEDNTDARRAVKDQVLQARLAQLKRKLK